MIIIAACVDSDTDKNKLVQTQTAVHITKQRAQYANLSQALNGHQRSAPDDFHPQQEEPLAFES